jgi:hypothetical protein
MSDTAEHKARIGECLAKATECEAEAERLRDPGVKQQWLALAQEWRDPRAANRGVALLGLL